MVIEFELLVVVKMINLIYTFICGVCFFFVNLNELLLILLLFLITISLLLAETTDNEKIKFLYGNSKNQLVCSATNN